MSIKNKKLSLEEIRSSFFGGLELAFPPLLTTKQAADLIGYAPKTVNEWKNAGLLEGTYRQRGGKDRYFRDRFLVSVLNGPDWDEKQIRRGKKS